MAQAVVEVYNSWWWPYWTHDEHQVEVSKQMLGVHLYLLPNRRRPLSAGVAWDFLPMDRTM